MEPEETTDAIERGGFFILLALVTLAAVLVVWPFTSPLLWAMLAAIMFQPLYQRILAWRPKHDSQAALLTLLIIFVAVIVPGAILGSMIVEQAVAVFDAFREGRIDPMVWLDQIVAVLPAGIQSRLEASRVLELENLSRYAQELGAASAGAVARQALAIGSGLLAFLLALGVGLYVTYFLLRDGSRVGPSVLAALPLEDSITARLSDRFLTIVRATIKGSVVVGLVQGILGAITFAIVGLPSVLLFGLVMAIASLLPALGPALVWVPAAIWLLATGQVWQGLVVIGSGVAVIGMADNILRPILVGRDTGIPDWVILVTTLGGIATFGLSGIVLGPLVAGLFIAIWSILLEQRAHFPAQTHDGI